MLMIRLDILAIYILAFVHQAIAAEREFVDNLFGIKTDKRMMGSARKLDNEEDWVKELMDLAVSKLCVPLRVDILGGHERVSSLFGQT